MKKFLCKRVLSRIIQIDLVYFLKTVGGSNKEKCNMNFIIIIHTYLFDSSIISYYRSNTIIQANVLSTKKLW